MADNKHWSDPEYRERTIASMREAGRIRRERNAASKASIPKPEPYHVPDLPYELWKDIPGFENHYKISNMGRVKSCDRIIPHKKHGTWHIRERILKPHQNGPGKTKYLCVHLHLGNGIMRCMHVHRLVAEAFIQNPHNLPQVNHIDGNKENNAASNLEWVSSLDNMSHAWKTGLCENIVKAKQVPVVNLDTGETFPSVAAAERSFGKSIGAISHVLTGKSKHAHGFRWAYVKE